MTASKLPADAEDLAIVARRGELSGAARAEFERALEASVTLRAAHRVGLDFDAIRDVRAGDDELVLRASALALAEPHVHERFGARSLAASAAALAVAASAAGASLWLEPTRVERFHAPPAADVLDSRPSKPGDAADVRSVAAPRIHAPEARSSAAAAAPQRKQRAPATPSPFGEPQRQSTAASLFEQASAARRAGELERAQSLFAELQRSFPNTSEARVSRVSLGKLWLSAGKAREAEQQFRAYLATGGSLTEEALVGRAESLALLGLVNEERRVWQELLARRPASVYAARARDRLRELAPRDRDPARAY